MNRPLLNLLLLFLIFLILFLLLNIVLLLILSRLFHNPIDSLLELVVTHCLGQFGSVGPLPCFFVEG